MRSLVADLGDAYCEELERTAIGPFRLEDADPAEPPTGAALVPLRDALSFLPERPLVGGGGRRRASRAPRSGAGRVPNTSG